MPQPMPRASDQLHPLTVTANAPALLRAPAVEDRAGPSRAALRPALRPSVANDCTRVSCCRLLYHKLGRQDSTGCGEPSRLTQTSNATQRRPRRPRGHLMSPKQPAEGSRAIGRLPGRRDPAGRASTRVAKWAYWGAAVCGLLAFVAAPAGAAGPEGADAAAPSPAHRIDAPPRGP